MMRRCDKNEHYYDEVKHPHYCPDCAPDFAIHKGFSVSDSVDHSSPSLSPEENKNIESLAVGKDVVVGNNKIIVGWFVVVDGFGKGYDLCIYSGQNLIGRGDDVDISLNFGDDTISADDHASIMFDQEEGDFALTQGRGVNGTRVNGKKVARGSEVLLMPFDRITLGNTCLLFMPLCNKQFSWESA